MSEHTWNIERGIALSIGAFAGFALSDSLRKYLSVDYPVPDILFWQAVCGMVALLLASPFLGGLKTLFSGANLKWHLSRGALMGVNTCMSLTALSQVPIMDAYTIFFLTPFVTTVLAVIFFKDHVGWHRVLAIVAGFVGGLVAFRPGFAALEPAYGFAFACCFTFGMSNLIARKAGGLNNALSFGFWPSLFLMSGLVVYFGGNIPVHDMKFYMICAVIGVCYMTALVCIAKSYTFAPSAVVAPYQYVQLLFGLALGYLLFGDFPDGYKIAGCLIIAVSGLFLFARERQVKKKAAEMHSTAFEK